ncbi:MAG: DUF2851 family protein [Saprospiraceae bacterium]|nr:DUF2851 family protein [Saprospiraceae bacterium]
MNELTLHYIWLHQCFDSSALKTVEGASLKVIHPGTYNQIDGPDFLFAHILLDGVSWYGHIELHLKAKDWDHHGHSQHPLYANLILHVILDHFSVISSLAENNVHTLILSPLILDKNLSINPKQIESSLKKNTLLCAPMNVLHPNPQGLQYFEELGSQRFLTKSMTFQETLKTEKYNWEKTCQNEIIKILCGKENGLLLINIISKIPELPIVKHLAYRHYSQIFEFVFGNNPISNNMVDAKSWIVIEAINKALEGQKLYLNKKGSFPSMSISRKVKLIAFLLGYKNFSFANFLNHWKNGEYQKWFQMTVNQKEDRIKLSKEKLEILLINVYFPLLHRYYVIYHNENIAVSIFDILREFRPEKNHKVTTIAKLGYLFANALQSQGAIELINNSCNLHKCNYCFFYKKYLFL